MWYNPLSPVLGATTWVIPKKVNDDTMKSKVLTITEMIDFAIERGFDVNKLSDDMDVIRDRYDRSWCFRFNDYLSQVEIQDLIMNDEFMKCVYGEEKRYFIDLGHDPILSDFLQLPTLRTDKLPSWLLTRVFMIITNDWDKAHQEVSDYIMKLKNEEVKKRSKV